jgi:hypothetical protein
MQDSQAGYLPKTGVRALLDVPVFRHGQLWGIVCFEDCISTRVWDHDECEFASSAVDLLASSARNFGAQEIRNWHFATHKSGTARSYRQASTRFGRSILIRPLLCGCRRLNKSLHCESAV